MATVPGEISAEDSKAAPPRKRWGWKRWAISGAAGLVAMAILALIAIDTPPGRRFIIDQIEAMEPANGMRIRIGRIDGSIYGSMTISDLRLYDPDGLFFEAPEIEVDWRPFAYIFNNRLRIESASSQLAILHRVPELIPSEEEDQPYLPAFDIYVGELDIAQLRFEEAVTGERRSASLSGDIDIRGGRAQANLRARSLDGGERLALVVDAEPDGDRFDIDVELFAPEDGIIAGLTGIERALAIDIAGQGTWSRWDGRALVDSGNARVVDLDLTAEDGVYTLGGRARTQALFDPGVIRRLTAPETVVSATATYENQLLDGRFTVRSAAALIEGRGGIDLGRSAFNGLVTNIEMRQPEALADNLSGRNVRLELRLDGPFASAGFGYRLTSPRASVATTTFENLRVEGEGRLSETPFTLPLTARASRVTGVPQMFEEILYNVRAEGALMITGEQIVADDIAFRSDRSRGEIAVVYELATGEYVVGVGADIDRFVLPGIGVFDIRTRVDVRPAPGGRFVVAGRAQARGRSVDNALFRNLAGGLPVADLDIVYGADGRLRFDNLRVRAPSLTFAGNGMFDPAGRIEIQGSGSNAQYGAFRVRAEGSASRPAVALNLANPLPAAGLEDVAVNLDPTAAGYAYRAEGGSMAGPFTSNGNILLPSNAPVQIEVAELLVADTRTTGQLTLADAGMVGNFDLTGSGLDGDIVIEPVDGVLAVRVDMAAEEARLGGEVATTIRQGMLDLDAILYDEPQITASVNVIGLRREGLSIARAAAAVDYRGGSGDATVSVAGSRGRDFEFAADADFTPSMITVNGGGEFEDRPIELTPVIVRREGPEWILEESTISYAGGGATASGRFGGDVTQANATLDNIPLSIVDIFYPETGFGGNVTGTIAYRQAAGETVPEADVAIRVRSLTRQGFALRPRPVNLGINGRIVDRQLAARAIMETDGEEIMRAQFRLSPFSGRGNFGDQIAEAPLFAEVRYNGPAETLWQLTGNETLSLSGPLLARLDASGTLDAPGYSGQIETENARLESALTGTVVEGITTFGMFEDARFTLADFTGTTPGGGTLTGNAIFDLGLAGGLGMDIELFADRAWLLRRDDISARVTGPLTILLQTPPGSIGESEGVLPEGSITGDLVLVEGLFQLGQAAPAVQVPQLNVIEINTRLDEPVPPPPAIEWQIAVNVDADNQFLVRGLGLDSEWAARLDVSGALSDFRIGGRMDLVRGAYTFAGKRFELERGRIDFYRNSPIDPSLDIVAEGDLDDLDATITIAGVASDPQIGFTSNPQLPQSELMSRLLFGDSITNLSAFEAVQLAAAVASLQGGSGSGLNPINAVRDAIGLDRLRIVPADPVEDRGTAVAGGLYVSRRLYVEVISDGQGYSATTTEFQLTRWLSLLASISTIGRASAGVEASIDY
ncbi:MAG: translocation/assembly module TamB [Sphingomonadaceae bacterium]|nr:translocation/assembly module TamB [Sphingomonadaceae bacterium]